MELIRGLLRYQLLPSSQLALSTSNSPLPHCLFLNWNRMSSFTFPSSRKRPRHFHQGPDEAEDEQREEEAAAAQPPAARLYRHALESIFGFLSLADLSRALAVSRSWSSAVSSMRSIGAAVDSLPAGRSLLELSASRLARHIGQLGSLNEAIALSQESLYSAGFRMSGLKCLHWVMPAPLLHAPLIFPPSLTRLKVNAASTALPLEVNLVIEAASCMPSLAALSLGLPELHPLVSLTRLRGLRSLQELSLTESFSPFTQTQADDLRAIPHLTSLDRWLHTSNLRLLLRVPHQLKWQKLKVLAPLDSELMGLLVSLPSLVELSVACCEDAALLPLLPNLRNLTFLGFARQQPLSSPEQMIQGVGQCAQLTSLCISSSKLTSAHMHALLSCMPALSKLQLANMPWLETLSFLSSEPLQRSLTSLTLVDCLHPALLAVKLRHIFALQQLTHLVIRRCFEKLDSLTKHDLKVPSVRLPKLVKSEVVEV